MSTTTTPQDLLEHALAASSADDCLVLLEETSEAAETAQRKLAGYALAEIDRIVADLAAPV